MRNRAAARVSHEAHHADIARVNVEAVRLREQGITHGDLARIGDTSTADNEKPGFSFGIQTPGGIWSEIDPFEFKVRAGNKKGSLRGQLPRPHLTIGRSGVRHHRGIFYVKFTLGRNRKTECHVAPLLEFRNDETRAYGVNRSCRDKNHVARQHPAPYDEIGDRAVFGGLTQLLRCQTPF